MLTPGEMDEFAVDARPQNLGVTSGEFLGLATEFGDLGRADEGEVLRPEEHDEPFALVGRVRDVCESVRDVIGDGCLQIEGRKFLTDAKHVVLLEGWKADLKARETSLYRRKMKSYDFSTISYCFMNSGIQPSCAAQRVVRLRLPIPFSVTVSPPVAPRSRQGIPAASALAWKSSASVTVTTYRA